MTRYKCYFIVNRHIGVPLLWIPAPNKEKKVSIQSTAEFIATITTGRQQD